MGYYDYRSYFNTLISLSEDIIENQKTVYGALLAVFGLLVATLAFDMIKQWRFSKK